MDLSVIWQKVRAELPLFFRPSAISFRAVFKYSHALNQIPFLQVLLDPVRFGALGI